MVKCSILLFLVTFVQVVPAKVFKGPRRSISSSTYDVKKCQETDKVENSCYFRDQKLFPMRDETTDRLKSEIGAWINEPLTSLSPDGRKFTTNLNQVMPTLPAADKEVAYNNMIDQYIEKYAFCKDKAKFRVNNLILNEDYFVSNTSDFAVANKEFNRLLNPKDPNNITEEEFENLKRFKQNKDLARQKLQARLNERFLKPENISNELMVCSEIYDNKNFSKVERVIFPECVTSLGTLFINNSWRMGDAGNRDEKFDRCLENMNDTGAKISKVIIESSSNLLNNTGETAEKFCRKGFSDLSFARAEEAKERFAKTLFKDQDIEFQIKSSGQNGDGTSGPCPYDVVDGKELLKSRYQTIAGKNALAKHNIVKMRVLFEEQNVTTKKEKVSRFWASRCKKLTVVCD